MTPRSAGVLLAVGGTVLAVAAAAVAAVGFGGREAEPPPRRTTPAATAQVTRQTLVRTATATGELTYGEARPLDSKAAGTVTWLAPVGSVVRRGGVLLRADERPVALLYGQVPMFRELSEGVEGTDVVQFERNLRALGYRWFTVDERFTDATARAVKRWQADLGLEETGKVAVGQVIYAPGPVRIATHQVRPGAAATAEVLTYSGSTKVVSVAAGTSELAWARPGVKVTLTLPDGGTVPGTVLKVGAQAAPVAGGATSTDGEQPAEAGGMGEEATVPVVIGVHDQRALGRFETAPVDVRHVIEERKDVLTVPVPALLALSEGGYAVEVVTGGTTRLVAVRTGMFADGRVEVRGDGIRAGVTVGMPK
ncbi:peptidoglycan-binding protein [Actinopolymorpha alba]|uniref:peptidoglycan-binding protein n=1 Tax=Actinopolymorpha alba TaxID=533267 RepID=UPI00036B0502|nr:peptidoglycan-binding domain-containing protein [Actinopolymorpha alba]